MSVAIDIDAEIEAQARRIMMEVSNLAPEPLRATPRRTFYRYPWDIPEIPGSRLVLSREGGRLPRGFWRVAARCVWSWYEDEHGRHVSRDLIEGRELFPFNHHLPSNENYWEWKLVIPKPAQRWWERASERTLVERWESGPGGHVIHRPNYPRRETDREIWDYLASNVLVVHRGES